MGLDSAIGKDCRLDSTIIPGQVRSVYPVMLSSQMVSLAELCVGIATGRSSWLDRTSGCAPLLSKVAGWACCLFKAIGCVQQSGRAIGWILLQDRAVDMAL